MLTGFLAFLTTSTCGGDPEPLAAEALFSADGDIWHTRPEAFAGDYGRYGFRWVSSTSQESARAYKAPITFLGMPVVEAVVRFDGGAPSEVVLSAYNRGDSGDMDKASFEKTVRTLQDRITAWLGVRPVRIRDAIRAAGANRDGRAWTKGGNQYKLEWSWSTGTHRKGFEYRSEYIRVECQRYSADRDYTRVATAKRATRGTVSASQLKSNVRRDENGDVFIDGVPMVDQGQKGYCTVAATERVMRLYGRDIDQHELAQLAMTSASRGTDPHTMVDVLRKLGIALGCRVTVHEDFDVGNFKRLVSKYNRLASKQELPRIELGRMIVLNEVYKSMDIDVLRDVRGSEKADMAKFRSTVQNHVARGIPLVWSVMAGKVDERPPVLSLGGHMRLVIGYNEETGEILYSDTWGRGHEKKRMPELDAWTVLMGLYTVEPRRMGP